MTEYEFRDTDEYSKAKRDVVMAAACIRVFGQYREDWLKYL